MAIKVIVLVLAIDPQYLTPAQKLVAVKYADHARPDGSEARPSIARVVYELGCSERHVQNTLRRMQATGILSIQRFAIPELSLPTCYKFNLKRMHEIQRRYEDRFGKGEFDVPLDTNLQADAPHVSDAPEEVQGVQQGGAYCAPKPSIKPSIKPSTTAPSLWSDLENLRSDWQSGRVHKKGILSRCNQLWRRSSAYPAVKRSLAEFLATIDDEKN